MYKTFVHEWFDEIWNKGNFEAIERLLAPDGIIHNLAQDGKDSKGPADFRVFFRAFHEAFPDIHVTVHETAAEGDRIFGRWTAVATHAGHSLGFQATNKRVSINGMSLARLKDGKLVEGWNVWEAAAMYQQLGFTTMPPSL